MLYRFCLFLYKLYLLHRKHDLSLTDKKTKTMTMLGGTRMRGGDHGGVRVRGRGAGGISGGSKQCLVLLLNVLWKHTTEWCWRSQPRGGGGWPRASRRSCKQPGGYPVAWLGTWSLNCSCKYPFKNIFTWSNNTFIPCIDFLSIIILLFVEFN